MTHSLYKMSNIRPDESGLNMVIWVSPKGKAKHGPRIKVQQEYGDKIREDEWFVMTIDDEPKTIGDIGKLTIKDVNEVKQFIILNKELLLKYWNDLIGMKELLGDLKQVG